MHRQSLVVNTQNREEFKDITAEIRNFIQATGVEKGFLTVFVPHTTAGVTVNEGADPAVSRDLLYILGKLVPHFDPKYEHYEGNSDAHAKASLLGSSLNLLVENGDLLLGTWQAVFFAEFDGPRQRRVYLALAGS
mgnify:FL=1